MKMKHLIIMLMAHLLATAPTLKAQTQATEKPVETYNLSAKLPSNKSLTLGKLQKSVRYVNTLLRNSKTELIMGEVGAVKKGGDKPVENKSLHQYFIARIEKVRENVRDIEIYKSFLIDGEKTEAARFLKEVGYSATGVPLMPELQPIAHMFKPTDMEGQNELKRLNLALDGLAQSEMGNEFSPRFANLSATTEKGLRGMQPADKAHIEDLLVNKIIMPGAMERAKSSMVMGSFIMGAAEGPEKVTAKTPDRRIRSFKEQENGAAQVKTFIAMSYLIATNEWAEDNGLRPINLRKFLPEENVKAIEAEKTLLAAKGDGVVKNDDLKSPIDLNAVKSASVLEPTK